MNSKLTIDDIADQREYERERQAYRARIIALKKVRRVPVGPIVTFVFENRETIRFQIQEMARVERLFTDEAIATELDTYNPLIPDSGELSATMFIEMVSEQEQHHWKPLLVGILDTIFLRVGSGATAVDIKAEIEEAHAEMLTREIPPSVNYVRFRFSEPGTIEAFAAGPVELRIEHPNYSESTVLSVATSTELLSDLQPSNKD